jgi:vacuolar iron transporter family protein
VGVLVAVIATGMASAALGRAPRGPAVLRNVIGGAIAMGVTYAVGMIVGTAVG